MRPGCGFQLENGRNDYIILLSIDFTLLDCDGIEICHCLVLFNRVFGFHN